MATVPHSSSHKVFSAKEKILLVDLIKNKEAIADKRSDVITISRKKAAWEEIEREFNSNNEVSIRTLTQLKKCWDNIKTKRRKEIAKKRGEMKTIDGLPPLVSQTSELDLEIPLLSNKGFCFDGYNDDINHSQDSTNSEPVLFADVFTDIDSHYTQDLTSTDIAEHIPTICTKQDHTYIEDGTGNETPDASEEVIQNLEVALSPTEMLLKARIRRQNLLMEYNVKLQALHEQKLYLMIDEEKVKLENSKREEERRNMAFLNEEKRKKLAFEWEEKRKNLAFDWEMERKKKDFKWEKKKRKLVFKAEERRKEEIHIKQLALMK